MPKQFERFRRAYVTGEAIPTVAVHRRGLLSMNEAAWKAIGQPETAVLLYDPESKAIGIESVSEEDPDGYRIRKHQGHSFHIAAGAFLKHYEIPDEVRGRRYRADVEDGILTFSTEQDPSDNEG